MLSKGGSVVSYEGTVTGGLRSESGAKVHAGYCFIAVTLRLRGRAAHATVRDPLAGKRAFA